MRTRRSGGGDENVYDENVHVAAASAADSSMLRAETSFMEDELDRQVRNLQMRLRRKEQDIVEMSVKYDSEIKAVQLQTLRANARVEELTKKMDMLSDLSTTYKEKAMRFEAEAITTRQEADRLRQTVLVDHEQLKQSLAHEREHFREQLSELQHRAERASAQEAMLRGEVEHLRAEAARSGGSGGGGDADALRVQLRDAQATIESLQRRSGGGGGGGDATVVAQLRAQLEESVGAQEALRAAKGELSRMRERMGNVELLREQLHSAQRKAERDAATIAQLQQQCVAGGAVQGQAEAVALQQAREAQRRVEELLRENEVLQNKVLESSLHATQRGEVAGQMEGRAADAQQQLAGVKEELRKAVRLAKRLKRKEAILKLEIEGYKRILQSHDDDDTNTLEVDHLQRVAELEATVERQRVHIETLEGELDEEGKRAPQGGKAAGKAKKRAREEGDDDAMDTSGGEVSHEEVSLLRSANARLNKHVEKLEREMAVMEERMGKGAFNVAKTKVLHLSMNPESQVRKRKAEELTSLREQREMLLKQLEEGGQAPSEGVLSQLKAETDELRAEVQSLKTRNERVINQFARTAQRFREMVLLTTGYTVDMVGERLYRLRSEFAERETDEIKFMVESDGLTLLDSDFVRGCRDEMELLRRYGSYPAFTASITLALFERSTKM